MMFRAVARVVLPFVIAATLCFSSVGQTTNSTTNPTDGEAPGTIGASNAISSDSNDVVSLYGTPVEQIVARVNDGVITNSDVTRAQTQMDQQARQENWSSDRLDAQQKNLLRDLIDQQLLLSKGKQLGITGDTELIKRLDDIRKQNHLGSMEELEKAVEGQGTSYEDFKANIRNSIITQQVVRDEVSSKLEINQKDIANYYKEHLDSFSQTESVHLNEILIPTAESPTDSQLAAAEAKAKEAEAKLKAGGAFADVAKEYSGGPTAQQGGDLGDFKRGALAKVLEDQTYALPVGGYTEPIRTRQGYIILQVTAHTPGGTPAMQAVMPQIEQGLYVERIEPAVRRYLTRLRDEAYIDIRPGFTDSAASPNQTKPTFTAYAPPQPKKKKKKQHYSRAARSGRMSERGRTVAAASTPSAAGAASVPTSAPASSLPATGSGISSSSNVRPVHGSKMDTHHTKRVKVRYGRAPDTPLTEQQVATTTAAEPATATAASAGESTTETAAGNATETATAGTDVQPLGPDLEHAPTLTQPTKTKTRLSDRARDPSRKKSGTVGSRHKAAKQSKHDQAKPTASTSTEEENHAVQSAPLGLSGDTVHKKKKVHVKNGEKVRLSDRNKESVAPPASSTPPDQTGGTPNAGKQPQQ